MDQNKTNNSANKKRVANFTDSECSLLLRVVNSYKNIIENKKTDAVTWKQKEVTWKKIAEKFNADSSGPPRSDIQLKYKYMAIKKNIKKQYSTHTSYLRGTGGGSYVPPPTPKNEDEKLLMETIAISVKGLQNEFDSDALAGCSGMSAAQLTSMDQSQIIEVDMIETDWNEPHAQLLQTPKHPLLNIYNLSDDEIEKENKVPETQENHPAVLSENLPNPHSEDLTTQKEFNLPQPTTWQTRRRPVIPKRKTVSSVAGKFEILAEQKCQLIEIEKNIAKQRETYSKTEQEMNLKLLEGQNEEQKLKIKFLESQLEEQKLKIELLKIQINNLQSVKKLQISSSGR